MRWREEWYDTSTGAWYFRYSLERVEYGGEAKGIIDWLVREIEVRLTTPDGRELGNMPVVLAATKDIPINAWPADQSPIGALFTTFLPEPDMPDIPKEFGCPVPVPMWDLARVRAYLMGDADAPTVVDGK